MHISINKLNFIGSDNGWSPSRRWNNAEILLMWHSGTNLNEISIEINIFSFKEMNVKMSFAKWRPLCLSFNMLRFMMCHRITSIILQPILHNDCHLIETFFALLALCAENSPVTGEFPSQRPVTGSFDVFFDMRLNSWSNNGDAGDLRRQCTHYDVTVMRGIILHMDIQITCVCSYGILSM